MEFTILDIYIEVFFSSIKMSVKEKNHPGMKCFLPIQRIFTEILFSASLTQPAFLLVSILILFKIGFYVSLSHALSKFNSHRASRW